MTDKLFTPTRIGDIEVANRVVMASLLLEPHPLKKDESQSLVAINAKQRQISTIHTPVKAISPI